MSHLDYLIRQDIEHGTFSPRNIFNDEYLTPQFYTYAKQLEEQIEKMKNCINCKYKTRVFNSPKREPCNQCSRNEKWECAE